MEDGARRFRASVRDIALSPHTRICITVEGEGGRPRGWSVYEPRFPAEFGEGDEIHFGARVARVLVVDGDAAVIALGGEAWVISPLRPDEIGHADGYLQGSGVAEWVVRSRFGRGAA